MTSVPTVIRPARLMIVVYGLWAAVLSIGGPQAEGLPAAPQIAIGLVVAVFCFFTAWHPEGLLRWAFAAVAWTAMWAMARVLADETYRTSTTIAGAVTYLTLAASALTIESMTAVLQGIDQAAKDQETDE